MPEDTFYCIGRDLPDTEEAEDMINTKGIEIGGQTLFTRENS
jgi:hypothetical protein